MKNIVVFCGSSEGYNERYRDMAFNLGVALAVKNTGIVYGGARVGLMGALAEGALENGGQVTGVIPNFLRTKEVAHEGLTRLILVNTMHERKLKMYELGDGFIAMPGGWGTMDELMEILTWGQLGLHGKPVGLLNINGFYDALIAHFGTMVQEGFLQEFTNNALLISSSIDDLLEQMENYVPLESRKWITKQTT